MTQVTRRGKTFQDLCAEAKTRIREIDKPTLSQWLAEGKNFVLIDTREAVETANGVIANAVCVPRGILELQIDDVVPDQDHSVVLYCGGGNRSALAAATLQEMGYANVYSLAGGWRAWNS